MCSQAATIEPTAVIQEGNHQFCNAADGGKFLTFVLDGQEYGFEILKVREIFGYMNVTSIPQTPHYIKGVINLRGKVIPVVDLRSKFGMDEIEVTDQTCIIVVEMASDNGVIETGIIVDKVSEVIEIMGENIDSRPSSGAAVDTEFISGMGKINDAVKILLNINALLGDVIEDITAMTGSD